jgi:hypothetical protein
MRFPLAWIVVAPTSLAAVRTTAARRGVASTDLQQDGSKAARRARSPVVVAQPTSVATATMKPIKTIRPMEA